jgi:acetoacetyl-CoA synthetase
MYQFMQRINERFSTSFKTYPELYQWSVDNIANFWQEVWQYLGVIASKSCTSVIDDPNKMPGAKWFPGARLNFAQNLLRYRDDQTALIFYGEDQIKRRITYAGLYHQVSKLRSSLIDAGVKPGDRVVGFMPNLPETVVAMLAAVSIGAVWSSCSPDFGTKGVLDRFGQIRPKVLFTADGYFFKGKRIDSIDRLAEIARRIPSIKKIVVVDYTSGQSQIDGLQCGLPYDEFIAAGDPGVEIDFPQLPFDHPLYIMYSSGTTGLPKCMVQSAGGILLHQLKELVLHTDLKRRDTLFYFTTCGWMMWNWMVCALSVGATIVLYDGNPFHPAPSALWKMAQDENITVFGTSAGYLSALKNSGLKPKEQFDLTPLRSILSTGSPLSIDGFDFVYEHIKSDVQLASISGGTDLNGCFALGNPMAPVYAGELQCRGLGMKVEAYDESGHPVFGQQGELVCTAPFPSMPLYFWDDPDGQKYHRAYFDRYPGVWRHGDFIEITESGGVIFYGRSDATLNPGGVRIGTAEIYRQLEAVQGVADSVVIGQNWKDDVRILLFVKMEPAHKLTEALKQKIQNTIRTNASPRHVPAKIVAVGDIPYTLNMKKVELAVRKVVHGEKVSNKDALQNPESLDAFAKIKEIYED